MQSKKILSAASAVVMLIVFIMSAVLCIPQNVQAVSRDYPAVLLRISTFDNSRNLNISGYDDKASAVVSELKRTQNENWRFDYVGTDSKGSFYKITNMGTGRLLTPSGYKVSEGNPCIIFGSESAKSQHWYVIPAEKDSYGNNLYYKILNYENTDLALSGRSSRSFLEEKNYQTLKNSLGSGDYLFIQFGHNDEKTDEAHTSVDNTHLSNAGASKIAQMIAEQVRKLGLSAGK